MKISTLIKELEEQKKKHGDICCVVRKVEDRCLTYEDVYDLELSIIESYGQTRKELIVSD